MRALYPVSYACYTNTSLRQSQLSKGAQRRQNGGSIVRITVCVTATDYIYLKILTWQQVFEPPLPPYLSFHLTVVEAALVLHLRTLEPNPVNQSSTAFGSEIGFSLRDRLFGPRLPSHDEQNDVFVWQGEEVKVKEKIRVETQDPSLIAVMAKLSALEHEVLKCRASLKIVMGDDEGDSDLE